MSTNTAQTGQQEWFYGIDLFSRLTGPIADLTRLQQSLLFAELSQIAYMPQEPALELYSDDWTVRVTLLRS